MWGSKVVDAFEAGYEIGRMRYDVECRGGVFPVPACPFGSGRMSHAWYDGIRVGYKDAKTAAFETMTPATKRQIKHLRDWNRAKAAEFRNKAAEYEQTANRYEELLKP